MIGNKELFLDFIEKNKGKDPISLRLNNRNKSFDFDVDFAITQIECRKKTHDKLKDFLVNKRFLFPDLISAEQSSHQAVARYHNSLVPDIQSVLDMTAGLGIDAITFAMNHKDVTAIELNPQKAEILNENSCLLGLSGFKAVNADSIEYLEGSISRYDLIFIDPSRRSLDNKKVYNLRDCLPDVIKYQDMIRNHAKKVFIKASPLLDVTQTLRDLNNISRITAVGVKGECKELLIELNPIQESSIPVKLEAVNLDNEGNILWGFSDEKNNKEKHFNFAGMQDLQKGVYILEPSAMLMKLSPWDTICERYKASKFDKSSHLFITKDLPEKFPGRVTRFEKFLTKKDRKSFSGFPATAISRNHPLSPEQIRKEMNLTEGDENFIYATRLQDKPVIFLTHKVN